MKNSLLLVIFFLLVIQCKPSKITSVTTSTANLENTYWKLAEMNGEPVITPEGAKEVHMILTGERTIKGFAGCNSIGGSYTLDGSKIKFITLSTKMFCQDRMDVENFFLNVLNQADLYKINGETLELYQGNTLLTTFQSVYLK